MKEVFCVQLERNLKCGRLYINENLDFMVNDHKLSEGEIVWIQTQKGFEETSIHISLSSLYASIGSPIDLDQYILYESDP